MDDPSRPPGEPGTDAARTAVDRRRRNGDRWRIALVVALVVGWLAQAVLLDNRGHLKSSQDIVLTALMYYAYIFGPLLIVLLPAGIIVVILVLLIMPRKRD